MSERDEKILLEHILGAIAQIEQYTSNLDYDAFIVNHLVQDGVVRQIEIIGEATKALPPEFTMRFFHVPWSDMAGMRDVLIHHYFDINLQVVWDTVHNNLPPLKQQLTDLLQSIQTA